MSALVCGLDVHKEITYATLLDNDGQVVTQKRMRNEEIPGFLEPYTVEKVAMEASTYIVPMYRKLVGEGYDVTVSHPKKTRYIAEARIKSDRVDSRALAELLRLNSLPESQHTAARGRRVEGEGAPPSLPGEVEVQAEGQDQGRVSV